MLVNKEQLNRFFSALIWCKTSVKDHITAFPQTKKVARGMLFYRQAGTDIEVYMCDDLLFQEKTSLIGHSGEKIIIIFDRDYFEKLVKSKFKSAFFGACAIQVARYIATYGEHNGQKPVNYLSLPPFLPSHKPELAQFFHNRYLANPRHGRNFTITESSYARFAAQAVLRGGYDVHEFEVDKKALNFFPIDDVLAAHAVDVETRSNIYLSAERVNRIRALSHFYERDLTKWDGCELQLDLI